MTPPGAAHPDQHLRQVFQRTSYGTASERVSLAATRELSAAWAAPGLCWAVLTAWNPAGQQQATSANDAAQAELRAALAAYPVLDGHNGAGQWTEPSLIAAGLRLRPALALAQRFGQAALLWGVGERAALVWCGPVVTERRWLAGSRNGW